jgi:hypothetical protein
MGDYIAPIIFALSQEYGFDYSNALIFAGLTEIKCLFPFCGDIRSGCRGIQWSYGLHTQCQKEIIDNGKYCFKCELKRENDKFLGDIDERLKCNLLDYVDKKGRKTLPWINYIKDKNFCKDVCLRAALEANYIIPSEHLEERIMRRGRPKKEKVKEVIKYCVLSVLDTGMEDILELYGNETLAKDRQGNIYDLYDFGAVKRGK